MRQYLPVLLCTLAFVSCSTVKLQEGERRLKKSKLKIEKVDTEGKLPTVAELRPYMRDDEKYSEKIRESSRDNIAKHMEYLGFYDSKVTSTVKLKKKSAKITYLVTPGHHIRIDSLDFIIDCDSTFRREFDADTANVTVHSGDILSEKTLSEECQRSMEHFRNMGYYGLNRSNYSFVADTISREGRLTLLYKVSQKSPKYRIGDINVQYPSFLKFRDRIFNGIVPVRSGDIYSDTEINTTYSRLANLNVFNGVNIEVTPKDSTSLVDCNIRMTPGPIQSFGANLEASVNASGLVGISPQLKYAHNNIFHGSERLTVEFNGNFQYRPTDKTFAYEFGIVAGLSLPRFLGRKYDKITGSNIPHTEFNASFSFQNRPEYKRRVFSFQYGYSGRIYTPGNYFTYQFFPLRLKTVNLHDMAQSFRETIAKNPMLWYSYMSHINAGENGAIYLSDSKELIPRTSYKYLRASLSLSGNILSIFSTVLDKDDANQACIFGMPFTQYAKTEISLGQTWRMGKEDKLSLAARFTAGIGYAYGNSSAIPFDEQFYCGGANSMRAWQARSLGPGDRPLEKGFIIPSQVGDLKLEADLEFRFPLFWKLEGAMFAETGNVWAIHHPGDKEDDGGYFKINDFYKALAADWGLGLRLDLNFLLVRLDWGMKLREPSRSVNSGWLNPADWFNRNGYAIQFGVGYPF